MNIIPGSDFRAKLATVMVSEDLPGIIHLYQGWTAGQNLPGFLKAKCADLTPYLAGDAAREYPFLAAIPTYAWRNSSSAIDGQLFLVPIHRQLPTFPGASGGYFLVNSGLWDAEVGVDYNPKNLDDFKRTLQQLNRPQSNRWGVGNTSNTTSGVPELLFRSADVRSRLRRAECLAPRRVRQVDSGPTGLTRVDRFRCARSAAQCAARGRCPR